MLLLLHLLQVVGQLLLLLDLLLRVSSLNHLGCGLLRLVRLGVLLGAGLALGLGLCLALLLIRLRACIRRLAGWLTWLSA
jgi:hypothetical protein